MSTRQAALVVATSNPGKLAEIRAILAQLPVHWSTLAEAVAQDGRSPVALPEEGDDYRENALAKARAAARQTGLWAVADDSGIEVAALGGAPGPRSARYGGPGLDDGGRVRRLLAALEGVPPERRAARFVCWAALAGPDDDGVAALGVCEGRVLEAPRGDAGFGYDPIFLLAGDTRTAAELAPEEKNRCSHRARAFLALAPAIEARCGRRAASEA